MKQAAAQDVRTRSIKSTMTFLLCTLVWTISFVLADKAALYDWYDSTASAVTAIVVNVVLGIVMVLTFMRHLRVMDELQRKIQMDALALALGAAMVGGFALLLMQTTGLMDEPQLDNLILLIFATHLVSTVVGNLRYR